MKSLSTFKTIVCSFWLIATGFLAGSVQAGLPDPGMTVEQGKTASY